MEWTRIFLWLAGAFVAAMLILWKLEELYGVLRKLKIRLIDLYCGIVDKKPEIQDWEHRTFEEDDQWYSAETMIAHACGGNVRLNYTNSFEALCQAIHDGFRVIEVDVRFTQDGRLVCTHDFEGKSSPPKYDDFISTRIDGRFTPMTLESCFEVVGENAVIVLDTKNRGELPGVAQWLHNHNSGRTPVYIQICTEEELQTVGPFPVLYNLTFTQDYSRVAAFCLTNGIRVVSISRQRIKENLNWRVLTEHNIKVYAHTVNSLGEFHELCEMGVTGVFTDYLIMSDTKDAGEKKCD